jgi:hypothetical protein
MDIEKLNEFIASWMGDRANNAISPDADFPAFDRPLVGCAGGADPLFRFLKDDIGPDFYWTPEEAFALARPDVGACADHLSVIAWILPQTERTRKAHRLCSQLPSREWSCGRHYGEVVNERLRQAVVGWFVVKGIVGQVRLCVPMVREACGPCLRTGNLRSFGRPHHPGRKGCAGRIGCSQPGDDADAAQLHASE